MSAKLFFSTKFNKIIDLLSTMSHNAHTMLAAKAEQSIIRRAVAAAKRVNLSKSDLVRIGTIRVIEEIEATGAVSFGAPQKKGGRK